MNIKKLLLTITTCMIISIAAYGQSVESVLKQISNINGVTTVYLSKSMLGSMKNTKTSGFNIGEVSSKLNYLEIITAENKKDVSAVRKLAKIIYNSPEYEPLIRIKDDGEYTYICKKTTGKTTNIIMLMDEDDEFTIIHLGGVMSLEDIQALTKGNNLY